MVKNQVFKHAAPFHLECGEWLPEFELSYTTYGELNEDKSNIVWVCHAFTGNANPSDWWNGLIGEKRLFNPSEHFIICVNVLGSHYGSTNALSINPATGSSYFHTFPLISIRDIVNSFEILRPQLQIDRINYLMGGSLGGQQASEWAVAYPDVIENLILFSTNAIHSPWGIAFNETQRMAIENDPTWESNDADAGRNGMKVARAIALLSYRNYHTYNRTQSRDEGQLDFFRASTYQTYQGEKLVRRFNAYSYWTLTKMFDSHDVSRERGSLEEALGRIEAKTLVVGITTDILFPAEEQRILAKFIPGATYKEIDSSYGHDGFLIEFETMTNVIKDWMRA
jgi:homoserine O-acetyltransferase